MKKMTIKDCEQEIKKWEMAKNYFSKAIARKLRKVIGSQTLIIESPVYTLKGDRVEMISVAHERIIMYINGEWHDCDFYTHANGDNWRLFYDLNTDIEKNYQDLIQARL